MSKYTIWSGTGPVPLPGDMKVTALLRDGRETDERLVENLRWGHGATPHDVVGYHITDPAGWRPNLNCQLPVSAAAVVNLFLHNGKTTEPLTAGNVQWDDSKSQPGLGIKYYRVVKDAVIVKLPTADEAEYTGGSVSYYTVEIKNPTTKGRPPCTVECNDIIEALGMSYAEGNAFKAIWRRCAARQGKMKKGYKDGLYDAEKVVFFGERMVEQEKAK